MADRAISPLEGVTVVELTQVLAGPFATMTLGDLGAEVIKLEAPDRGDRARRIEPVSEYFDSANRNKRSVEVDLKSEEGRRKVRELIDDVDVFVESTKSGRIAEYGLSYEDLSARNEDLIYCSISGFGSNSPYEDIPAWDIIVQGMSGIMSMTGEADGPPVWSGLPSGDIAAAMYTVQSVLAALYARRDGKLEGGEYIEVPMLDSAISWLSIRAGHVFGTGEPYPRGNHHPTLAPFGVFECRDEQIIIAAPTGSLWNRFCESLDGYSLEDDDRFETGADRVENRDELVQEIEDALSERSVEEWVGRMHRNEVPAAPVNDARSVWDDEHVERHELRRSVERDEKPDAQVIDHPIAFRNIQTTIRSPPPELGEHTDEYLD